MANTKKTTKPAKAKDWIEQMNDETDRVGYDDRSLIEDLICVIDRAGVGASALKRIRESIADSGREPLIKRGAADEPWISSYPPLQAWLNEHDARCVTQLPMGDKERPIAYVEFWSVQGRTFCLTIHANRRGWDVYTHGDANDVTATLKDLEARLKLDVPS